MKEISGIKFREIIKGSNFMTPIIEGYYQLENGLIIEISRGKGFQDELIIGITVADPESGEHLHDLGDCFFSRDKAEGYIQVLEGLKR